MSKVDDCFEGCRKFLDNYIAAGKELGIKLVECRKMLDADEWEQFQERFQEYGLNSKDIKAAMMLAKETLQPELYFCGVKNDKILNLREGVRAHLVDPKYQIAIQRENDKIEHIPFLKMTPAERKQVIGRNRILEPNEQKLPNANNGNSGKPNVGAMNYVTFLDSLLIFKGAKLEYADMNIALFKTQLASKNQLQAFIEFLKS